MPRDNGYVKVFCNSIGWVKSAKSVADYNRLPKVLINSAELLTYSQRRYGQILMIFLQSCKMRIVSHGDENNFYLVNLFTIVIDSSRQLPTWLWSVLIKMASLNWVKGGQFSQQNEVDQFWSHCITLTSCKYLLKPSLYPTCGITKKLALC